MEFDDADVKTAAETVIRAAQNRLLMEEFERRVAEEVARLRRQSSWRQRLLDRLPFTIKVTWK